MSADPDAGAWRQIAASFAELAVERVREAFAWIDAELAASGSDGAVTLMLALSDWDGGMPLHAVIGEILIWADDARTP